MPSTSWPEQIRALAERCTRELLTKAAFDEELSRLLSDSTAPFTHVKAVIRRGDPHPDDEVGSACDGDPQLREQVELRSPDEQLRIDCWTVEGRPADHQAVRAVINAIRAFDGADRRVSDQTALITASSFGTRAAAAAAVQRMVERRGAAPLFFADLDGLGALNAKHGQVTIDGVIGQLAAVIETSAPDDALVLHRSAACDEFYLLYPGGADEAIRLAWRVTEAVASHRFPIDDPINLSIGIHTIQAGDRWTTFDELERAAGLDRRGVRM
jgi:GGDEF domain-containing protein